MIKSRICSWEIDRFIQAAIDEVTLRFGADILANAKKNFCCIHRYSPRCDREQQNTRAANKIAQSTKI